MRNRGRSLRWTAILGILGAIVLVWLLSLERETGAPPTEPERETHRVELSAPPPEKAGPVDEPTPPAEGVPEDRPPDPDEPRNDPETTENRCRFVGTVRDPAGFPIQGATITALDDDRTVLWSVETGVSGEYEKTISAASSLWPLHLHGAAPGREAVVAPPGSDRNADDPAMKPPDPTAADPLDRYPTPELLRTNFVLGPGVELRGRLVWEDGAPVPGARIRAYLATEAAGTWRGQRLGPTDIPVTDDEGRFAMGALPPSTAVALIPVHDGHRFLATDLPFLIDTGKLESEEILTLHRLATLEVVVLGLHEFCEEVGGSAMVFVDRPGDELLDGDQVLSTFTFDGLEIGGRYNLTLGVWGYQPVELASDLEIMERQQQATFDLPALTPAEPREARPETDTGWEFRWKAVDGSGKILDLFDSRFSGLGMFNMTWTTEAGARTGRVDLAGLPGNGKLQGKTRAQGRPPAVCHARLGDHVVDRQEVAPGTVVTLTVDFGAVSRALSRVLFRGEDDEGRSVPLTGLLVRAEETFAPAGVMPPMTPTTPWSFRARPGSYLYLASADGKPSVTGRFSLEAPGSGGPEREIVVTFPDACVLEGKLIPPPTERIFLQARLAGSPLIAGSRPPTARVQPDGAYRFLGLAPGSYDVTLLTWRNRDPSRGAPSADLQIERIQVDQTTTTHDIEYRIDPFTTGFLLDARNEQGVWLDLARENGSVFFTAPRFPPNVKVGMAPGSFRCVVIPIRSTEWTSGPSMSQARSLPLRVQDDFVPLEVQFED